MAKVLIVDDSKLARQAARLAIKRAQPEWVCVEAADAADGLAVARRETPDIALLDHNMPGGNGLVLLAELRALYPTMPIAMVTANLQTEVVASVRSFGAVFIAKPLDPIELMAFLRQHAPTLPVVS